MNRLSTRIGTAHGSVRALARARRRRARYPVAPPTWPVAPEIAAGARIRWPERYEWPQAAKWVGGLRLGLAAQVPLTVSAIEQPYEGVVLIEFELDGIVHEVAIDYFDRDRVLDEVAARCRLVFKMQYLRGGYGLGHIIPGGYVPGHGHLQRYLPGLRHLRDSGTLRYEVYGRFGAAYAADIRRTAVEALSAQDRFAYEGGLVIRPYSAYLEEAALSRVCVDLPGNGDMCHRLIEYLAIGCCVVRPMPQTRLHVELTDNENIRYAEGGGDQLVAACAELASDPSASRRLGAGARDHFDRYLAPDQLAGYYLNRCAVLLAT